jgi:hypothetical protein
MKSAHRARTARSCPFHAVDQPLRACVLLLNEHNDFLKCCLVAPQHGNLDQSRRRMEHRIRQTAGHMGKPARACILELAEQRQARVSGLEAGCMLCMVYRES